MNSSWGSTFAKWAVSPLNGVAKDKHDSWRVAKEIEEKVLQMRAREPRCGQVPAMDNMTPGNHAAVWESELYVKSTG